MSDRDQPATQRAAADADRVPRRAWLVFAAVAACSFQNSLSLSITNVAFPSLRDDFPDIAPSTLSWVLNLYTIVAGASLVVCGVLVERRGRRRMLLLGTGAFAAASLWCALAPGVGMLLAGRVMQAVASALVTPASVALIVRAFPDSHRATAVAGWAAVGSVAASLGPTLGGLLVEWGGWRWAFYANLPGAAVGLVLTLLVVEESRDDSPRPIPDLVGAALIVVSVSLVVGGLVQTRSWGWGDPLVWLAIGAGLGLGAVLVRRSWRHPAPILDITLFAHRSFTLANLGTFVFGVGFFASFFGYVLFLTDVWRRGTDAAGLLMTPLALCGAVLAPLSGRIVRRRGAGVLLLPGGLCVAAGGSVLLVAAGGEPQIVSVWLPALVLIGTGAGLVWPSLFAGVVADVPRERYAVATGINQTIQRTATALGVALAVTLLGPTRRAGGTGHFDRLFVLTIVCGLGTAAIAPFVGLGRRAGDGRPSPAAPATPAE
jgi:EmrB/QacA subfamily drug resistance transporter